MVDFGFIKTDDGGADVFVHIRQIAGGDEPHTGDQVRYEIGTNSRTGRPEAKNVARIQD